MGKSSLCNYLLKEKKALVSSKRGTTHDSVEYLWKKREMGSSYALIDTAGLDRGWKDKTKILVLSGIKSQQSLKKGDLICLVLDAVEGPHHQDSKWIQQAVLAHKKILILINKTDLLRQKKGDSSKEINLLKNSFIAKMQRQFHFFPDIPYVFISAKTGLGVHKIMEKIKEIEQRASLRIPTHHLNSFLNKIRKGQTSKSQIYYITQTQHCPPAFMIFCNKKEYFSPSYCRFLINRIKEQWELKGIPIKLIFMPKKKTNLRLSFLERHCPLIGTVYSICLKTPQVEPKAFTEV